MHLEHGKILIRTAVPKDAAQLCLWWNDGSVMEHAGYPNGLGTTVEVFPGHELERACACIAEAANIVGVVNMEFICHDGAFYFLEVNPRFSGGVGFSMAAGADFAAAMLLCHRGECLPGNQSAKKCILARESRITITRE